MSSESIRVNLPHGLISTPSLGETHTKARPILCRRYTRIAIIGEIAVMATQKELRVEPRRIGSDIGSIYPKKPPSCRKEIFQLALLPSTSLLAACSDISLNINEICTTI